jgi:hypothetical protein
VAGGLAVLAIAVSLPAALDALRRRDAAELRAE